MAARVRVARLGAGDNGGDRRGLGNGPGPLDRGPDRSVNPEAAGPGTDHRGGDPGHGQPGFLLPHRHLDPPRGGSDRGQLGLSCVRLPVAFGEQRDDPGAHLRPGRRDRLCRIVRWSWPRPPGLRGP